ncbi:hypothetical protein Daus18300_002888 [Diaporthe australafricana]|uniref:Transcription factor domain-containing protein n=1 Tax=Diaporthe australafricana TaxID=127596 RepID=A0ABR3XKI6_9PEZI
MTMPYTTLKLQTSETLLEIPEPNAHPVLIARHMLLIATFLQHLHPDLHLEMEGLSESPRAIMERLADLAARLVTSNDELLDSIEGLECIMIEGVYHANTGNLRRSWVAGRRAMSIAQLMGLNRSGNQTQYKVLDPKTKYHPQLMWFRIVFLDRYLGLMLGLSQGSLDRSMASEAMLSSDTPMGRLERVHCVVASWILKRNESPPSSRDLALTRQLDVELQTAARRLPSKWWLAPNLGAAPTDSQSLFWNTRRLFAQLLHYNLLNQLHLPYLLRSSSGESSRHDYSRATCVNASREVLSRFVVLRSFNGIAYSCRTVDFLALMAAMTLLLAHLDGGLSDADNLLAHQYHSYRAMIEQVHENMQELSRLNSDALSARSASLLGQLLDIEIGPVGANRVSVVETGTEAPQLDEDQDEDEDAVVSVHIPYFGTIRIARAGISKEVFQPQAATEETTRSTRFSTSRTAEAINTRPQMDSSGLPGPGSTPEIEVFAPSDAGFDYLETSSIMASDATGARSAALRSGSSGPSSHQGDYHGLAAESEDWAFQGADWAFFENLMRNAGNEDSTTGWTASDGVLVEPYP